MSDGSNGQGPRLWRPGEGGASLGPEATRPFRPFAETAAKGFASELRRASGQDVTVTLVEMKASEFGDAARALPRGVINVLRLDGWHSPALLAMDKDLLGLLTDVYFGGAPRRASDPRAQTAAPSASPVTQRLARRTASLFLASVEGAMRDLGIGTARVTRQETDVAATSIMNDGEAACVATFRLSLTGQSVTMSLVLPLAAVRRALDHFNTERQTRAAADSQLARRLPAIEVEVLALLGQGQATTRQLMELEIGDVLTLDSRLGEPIFLLVEGRPKLAALPTEHRGHRAFRIVA